MTNTIVAPPTPPQTHTINIFEASANKLMVFAAHGHKMKRSHSCKRLVGVTRQWESWIVFCPRESISKSNRVGACCQEISSNISARRCESCRRNVAHDHQATRGALLKFNFKKLKRSRFWRWAGSSDETSIPSAWDLSMHQLSTIKGENVRDIHGACLYLADKESTGSSSGSARKRLYRQCRPLPPPQKLLPRTYSTLTDIFL